MKTKRLLNGISSAVLPLLFGAVIVILWQTEVIDMNDEGVAMLEDNLFCSKAFAEANPNTVKAFVTASMKGWAYACANPEEAAEIVFQAGSSVSADHQAYMASEVAKLVSVLLWRPTAIR